MCLTFISTLASAQNGGTASQNVKSGVPHLVKFSGVLKDSSGSLLNDVVGAVFAVYSDQTGGTPLWQETRNVRCSQGRYTIVLGESAVEGIPDDVFASGQPRWLGVRVLVTGEPEQARILLASVPYALKAADADTLGGLPASAFLKAQDVINNSSGDNTPAGGSSRSAVRPLSSSNVTTSGGTVGVIPLFSTATDIENSHITDTSGAIGVKGPLSVQGATSLNGGATASTLNSVLNPMSCAGSSQPSWCSGSDLGAWINSAIQTLPGNGTNPKGCGIIQLPYQSQASFTTTIVKPRCTLIDLNQSTILWVGTAGQAIVVADNYSGGPASLGSIRNGRIFGGTGQTISTSNGIFLGGDPAGVISPSTALATNQTFYDLDVQNFKDDFIVGNNTYVDTWVGGVIALSSEAGIHFKSGTTNTGENFALIGVDFGNNQSHDILVDSNASAEINATGTSFDYAGGDSISSAGSLYFNASSSHFERNVGAKFINCSSSCSVGVANSAMYLKGNAASTDAFGQFAATSRASFVGVDWANFSSTSAISQFFIWNDSSGSLYMLNFRNTLGLALDIVPAYSGSVAPLRFFDSRALIANQVNINQTAIAAPRLGSGADLNIVTQCGLYDVQNAVHGPAVFGAGFFHLQVLCTNDTNY